MHFIRLFFTILFLAISFVQAQSVVERPIVLQKENMKEVIIQKNISFSDPSDSLSFDIYYPPNYQPNNSLLPVVVFANGGVSAIPDWRVYQEWAKLMAANGLIAINHRSTWESRYGDLGKLLDFLHQNGHMYGIHSEKIGVWACSGNVAAAYPQVMDETRTYLQAIVFYYGMSINFEKIRQDLPIMIVRAGKDSFSLNTKIDEFIAQALQKDINLDVVNYLTGDHAFDVLNDNDRSRYIIQQTIDFFQFYLSQPRYPSDFELTARNFYEMIKSGKVNQAYKHMRNYHKQFEAAGRPNSGYHRVSQEASLNSTLYQLISENHFQQAIELGHFIIELFPDSPNAFDSLADAYETAGEVDRAIAYSEKTLDMLAKHKLNNTQESLIRKSALERLKRLEEK